jgi:hypothetical protein
MDSEEGITSRGAPTGHKLFNFISTSFQPRRWAHLKRSARNTMGERRETYAYLWIEGFQCDASEISAAMQLEPDETRREGDLIERRFDRTGQKHYWPKSSWSFRSSLPTDEISQASHIENLLDAIEPRSAEIMMLRESCEMGINCVGYYWGANPGFHLSEQLIQRCAALRLSIDFDLYNFEEENEEAEQAGASDGDKSSI